MKPAHAAHAVDPAALARLRAHRPEAVAEAAARRVRRPLLGREGRLLNQPAHHPCRWAPARPARPRGEAPPRRRATRGGAG
ncbi:hypothetical protein ACFW0U_14445, partial [Streptomyces albidoflavus]